MKKILGDQRGSRCTVPWKGKRFSPAEFRKYDWDVDDAPFVAGLVGHGLEKSLIGARSRPGRGLTTTPLKRYLARQVGRPWNDILSEVRAALGNTGIAKAHPWIFEAHVAVDARIIDGQLMAQNWSGLVPLSQITKEFYVDPTSGRLHRNTSIETHRMRQKRLAAAIASEQALRMRTLSPIRQLHRLADGNWWEVTLAPYTQAKGGFQRDNDAILSANLSALTPAVLYGRSGVYAKSKRQLSKAEIKYHCLR